MKSFIILFLKKKSIIDEHGIKWKTIKIENEEPNQETNHEASQEANQETNTEYPITRMLYKTDEDGNQQIRSV